MTFTATIAPESWDSLFQLVSAAASLILAVFAIRQASKFAARSSQDAARIEESNQAIRQSVMELRQSGVVIEQAVVNVGKMVEMQQNYFVPIIRDLINRFPLPDAASAERSEQLVERKVSERVEQLKADLTSEVPGLLDKAGKSDPRLVAAVSEKLVGAVDLAREADRETREENLKDQLLSYFNSLPAGERRMTVFALLFIFRDKFLPLDIVKALKELRQEGVVQFDRELNDSQEIPAEMTFRYLRPA